MNSVKCSCGAFIQLNEKLSGRRVIYCPKCGAGLEVGE